MYHFCISSMKFVGIEYDKNMYESKILIEEFVAIMTPELFMSSWISNGVAVLINMRIKMI